MTNLHYNSVHIHFIFYSNTKNVIISAYKQKVHILLLKKKRIVLSADNKYR